MFYTINLTRVGLATSTLIKDLCLVGNKRSYAPETSVLDSPQLLGRNILTPAMTRTLP